MKIACWIAVAYLIGSIPFGLIIGIVFFGVDIREHGVRMRVDFSSIHKTGYFLDQRENRALVRNNARLAAALAVELASADSLDKLQSSKLALWPTLLLMSTALILT